MVDDTHRRDVEASSPSSAPRSTLPRSLTRFIGREQEIALLHELLTSGDTSVITLTGPGGVGKTRLATEAARSVDGYPDGVRFVDLSARRDPSHVAPTVLRAVGGIVPTDRAPEDALVDRLHDARMLLLLDNVGQVLDAAPLVGRLAAACPGLVILVTSRVRLDLSGERVVAVPPLVVPEPDEPAGATAAERLFLDRVR